MTQAVNLANFANNLDSSGGVSPSALNAAVPVSKGGTNATTASAARTNLGLAIGTDVPSPTGSGASGTWSISISGSAAQFGGQAPSYYQTALGYTPVQQGTGIGQNNNIIKIGWDNSSKLLCTVDSTDQGAFAFQSQVIGIDQTWQNVMSSRSLGATYTNNTGKPIQVTASVRNRAIATVNGVTVFDSDTVSCCGVPQISFFPISFIVPAGNTYSISGAGVTAWAELR